ncbi:MAG: GAF domain-containing sensor histidine kinase [Candidatus Omnitrophica bacterium]|nr:GAF domain-containing sensor histidine kinase [Candidatus Omnitrophota bacterium]
MDEKDEIKKLIETINELLVENGDEKTVLLPPEKHQHLTQTINELANYVEKRFQELQQISKITETINSGLILDDVLNQTYEAFHTLIPYNRIGFALLEDNGTVLRARWARTESTKIGIYKGYSAPMAGSSLEAIIQTRKPRILNDLEDYLAKHPNSDSTRRIVEEGMRSSLTCPLVAMDKAIGFIFFSSQKKNTYQNLHVEIFKQIANQLSIIAEKSRLYEELLNLNTLKDYFLGMAAHDLRSPLGFMLGHLELFLDDSLGPVTGEQREVLERMAKNCQHMLDLIQHLLDISAIQAGKLELNKQLLNPKTILEECVDMNRYIADHKKITLHLETDNLLAQIEADPVRIMQVFSNLLTNAIKFSHPKTAIRLKAEKDNGNIVFSVSDQGMGIPEKELDSIFVPFTKGSPRPTGGESSTGLGLAIVKKMVEIHGGKIWVKSQVGVGSTFYVTLPIASENKLSAAA